MQVQLSEKVQENLELRRALLSAKGAAEPTILQVENAMLAVMQAAAVPALMYTPTAWL